MGQYQDSNLYFDEYLSPLRKKDMIAVLRQDAEFALKLSPDRYGSFKDYLLEEYGITNLTSADRAVISAVVENAVRITSGQEIIPPFDVNS